jgi:DNA-binding GntR family transcriptional regulator
MSDQVRAQERRRHPTAAEFIAEELRTDIVLGRLQPAELLPLEQLAERFGTSVIPVREALRVLKAEGHVILRPHRTAQVAELTLVQHDDLFKVLLVLQPEAVRWAHGNLSDDDLTELRRMIDRAVVALERDDYRAAFAIHIEIQLKIIEAAHSPVMLGILERLLDERWRYRYGTTPASEEEIGAWVDNHLRVVDVLEHGTADAAAEEMRRQIEQLITDFVRKREEATGRESVPEGHATT